MRRSVAALAVGASLLAIAASCREPTQITLVLTTDVDCATVLKTQTEILVGSRTTIASGTALSTSASTCSGKDIGTIAIVPGGGDTVAINVYQSTKVGKASSTCAANLTDCIAARRVIGFIPHTPLTLPIDLSLSCLNVPCGTNETCVTGKCVSDTVNSSQCKNGVCGPDTLPPADAGVPEDAGTDAGTDAGCDPSGLATDPKNCGACGFDCTGGTCTGGVCRLDKSLTLPPDANGESCLAVTSASGQEEVYWTRTTTNFGVYRIAGTGGTPTPFFSGAVGGGIAGSATRIAFTSPGGSFTTLWHCDPSLPSSACKSRTDATFVVASKFVATTDVDSYAMYPTKVLALSAANDYPFSSIALGPIAATPLHIAFERRLGGGWELDVLENKVPASYPVVTPGPVAADPNAEFFYFGEVGTIQRADFTGKKTIYQGLPSNPAQLAADAGGNLFWTAIEKGLPTFYRGTTGGAPVTTLYASATPIQCIAASKNAIFWVSQGVPYKGHK